MPLAHLERFWRLGNTLRKDRLPRASSPALSRQNRGPSAAPRYWPFVISERHAGDSV